MAKPRFYYDNRFDDGTPAASTTAAGDFNVLNLRDWRPYTFWKPTALPATITVDCGSAKVADYALIYAHDLFTQGATIEVRGSTDNFGASNVLVATSTPTSNDPLLLSFSGSFRYWRFNITGTTMPSIAIAVIGAMLEAPVFMEDVFDPTSREVYGTNNKNENGQPLGRSVYFEEWAQQIILPNVTWTWVRATFLPAWRSKLRSQPFGFCWEADLYPGEVRLVTAGTTLATPHSFGSLANVQIDLSGVTT